MQVDVILLRPTVAICVHLPEDLVCALLWCGLIFGHLHHRRNHLVDSLNRAKARGRHFKRKARNTKVRGHRLHTSQSGWKPGQRSLLHLLPKNAVKKTRLSKSPPARLIRGSSEVVLDVVLSQNEAQRAAPIWKYHRHLSFSRPTRAGGEGLASKITRGWFCSGGPSKGGEADIDI